MQKHGIQKFTFVDSLLENHERAGSLNWKNETLIKNAAAQIYGGMLLNLRT